MTAPRESAPPPPAAPESAGRRTLGLSDAVALAVGSIIGASIFSILGYGAELAGAGLPIALALSGIWASLVAGSYAALASHVVSDAGALAFVFRAFGDGIVTGAASMLKWFTYVVSLALFARSFGGYFVPLVGWTPSPTLQARVAVALLGAFTVLGVLGSRAVSRVERLVVAVKLAILFLFVAAGLPHVQPARLVPDLSPSGTLSILRASALFFLSYMGFGLLTNAGEEMRDPKRTIPRAIFLSLGIVMLVYVGVGVVAVGNLPIQELVAAQDYALARAAEPAFGRFGYLLVSVGALISITSALNATLFGGANLAFALAHRGHLPEVFERRTWFGAPEGLFLTAGLAAVLAVAFPIGAIAGIIAAVGILEYLGVLLSHWRLRGEVGGNRAFLAFAIAVVAAVWVVLEQQQWAQERTAFSTTWVAIAASLVLETLWRRRGGRRIALRLPPHSHRVRPNSGG